MVQKIVLASGVQDARVLDAMRKVPRHEFVPELERPHAYEDRPLPIGHGQAISEPHIVAIMAEVAEIGPGARVLEIGTGSGYGAAVLAEIAAEVFTIEIIEPLAAEAGRTLERLGYRNVRVRAGDGYRGWPEEAPFDAIIVTAAPPEVPGPLKDQLKVGGRLVVPVGTRTQHLRVVTRTPEGFVEDPQLEVRFVPMAGEAQRGG
jgi:protein-L-isoaspartate(D-aspartate) O-methyltransferase